MIPIQLIGRDPKPYAVCIGMETDHNAESLSFDLPRLDERQTAVLNVTLPDGKSDVLPIVDGQCAVTRDITACPGTLRAWVEISVGAEVVWHSNLILLTVTGLPPIGEQVERQYPTALQRAVEQTAEYARQARAAAGANACVTPDMYGAVGDGVHDDGPALKAALESGRPVKLTKDLYVFSQVWVKNRNVNLDGQGFTIYVDARAMRHDTPDSVLLISSDVVADETAPVAMVTDADTITLTLENGVNYHGNYNKGYISYHGRNPTPDGETYENPVIQRWREYSAVIRNVNLQCKNCECLTALELRRMCHSVIDHVSAVCQQGHDGAAGIQAHACYAAHITHCYAEGWCSARTATISSEGYGIVVSGDSITVDHCVCVNNKHDYCAGAARDHFDTGLIMNDNVAYRYFTRETRNDGSARYMQQFDIHASCHQPIVNDLHLICENAQAGTWHISIRCPKAHLNNVTISALGGVITCGELAQEHLYTNLMAENCDIRTQAGRQTDFLTTFTVNGGKIRRVSDCDNPAKVILKNVEIGQLIEGVRFIRMEGCTLLRNMDWPSKPSMTILCDAEMLNCVLYGQREVSIPPSAVIVKAPENSVRLVNCKIYKRRGNYKTFSADQPEAIGGWEENVFGLRLGTEQSLLGTYELY
ncbi:MAG: hypothetical protein IJ662_10325 [Clostridia bacterium]|nr:hypothetical protein [Clostridia bacterium]